MSNPLLVLRQYALKSAPATALPSSILYSHNDNSLIIFDVYPKAIFHFLILPRPRASLNVFTLSNLKSLLHADKKLAKSCLLELQDAAHVLRVDIEAEMIERYGFKWDVWVGFHALPSMEHLHLHVISSDLHSPSLKSKKHFNTFHPTLGFFLHLEEVLEWFDHSDDQWNKEIKFLKADYEPLLKETMECPKCQVLLKNIPEAKEHLKDHFEFECEQAKKRAARKESRNRKQSSPVQAAEDPKV